MILIAFRNGLRAGELCDLQWHQVEPTAGRLHVRRSICYGTPADSPWQTGRDTRVLQAWLGHRNIQHNRYTDRYTELVQGFPARMSVLIHEQGGRRTIYYPDDRHLRMLARQRDNKTTDSGQLRRSYTAATGSLVELVQPTPAFA